MDRVEQSFTSATKSMVPRAFSYSTDHLPGCLSDYSFSVYLPPTVLGYDAKCSIRSFSDFSVTGPLGDSFLP